LANFGFLIESPRVTVEGYKPTHTHTCIHGFKLKY